LSAWKDARDAVREAIDDGWPLANVEAWLLDGLPDEDAAALWLYAWSYAELRPPCQSVPRAPHRSDAADLAMRSAPVIAAPRPLHLLAPPSP